MSKSLEILLLADRNTELSPNGFGCPFPLLPVANKPIIEHLLETIARHAPANVLVRIKPADTAVREFLEGRAWPDMSVVAAEGTPEFVDRPTLAVRADIFPSPLQLEAALMQVINEGKITTQLDRFGITWIEAGAAVPPFKLPDIEGPDLERFLPNVTAYYQLAIAAGRGAFVDLTPGGWLEDDGLRASLGAQIRTRRAIGRNVEVGVNARIEAGVSLGDNIIVGNDAYIATGAHLENVIVLPNTYVGPESHLRNAVVCGDWLCRIEGGTFEAASETKRFPG